MFLPNFFSPRLKHQFIVHLEGIDSYKISSIEFPKSLKPYHGGISGGIATISVILCTGLTDSSEEQINDLCKKQNISDVKVALLDNTGAVTCTYTLNQCSISEVKLPILSYNSNSPLEWVVSIAFKRLLIS